MNETTSVQIYGLTAHLPTLLQPIYVEDSASIQAQRSFNRPANDNKEKQTKAKIALIHRSLCVTQTKRKPFLRKEENPCTKLLALLNSYH